MEGLAGLGELGDVDDQAPSGGPDGGERGFQDVAVGVVGAP
ncbi:hypothetical protein ACFQ60_00630 [Streptomyces zhihengii]